MTDVAQLIGASPHERLWVQSPVREPTRGNQLMFLSLSLSLCPNPTPFLSL